ncbi:MAG TPA: hypothetical protein VES67_11375 [Vicinamibacterales bacterium]|nr:hypothetical protein [Vicinamibacterales bacterium]
MWTEWAKPVAFVGAMLPSPGDPPIEIPPITFPGLPESWTQAAIVVDLPGQEAVGMAVALADRGFRPVPLFNGTVGPNAVIDVEQITRALGAGAGVLSQIGLEPDAHPAFLLDSRRGEQIGAGEPGRYDNRWVVLPQDFPSAAFLGSKAVREVIVIQKSTLTPAADLAHVLYRWQESGIRLKVIDVESGQVEDDAKVQRPSKFRRAWYVAVALLGLRRSNAGGFGSTVPQQTAGRSGFYG